MNPPEPSNRASDRCAEQRSPQPCAPLHLQLLHVSQQDAHLLLRPELEGELTRHQPQELARVAPPIGHLDGHVLSLIQHQRVIPLGGFAPWLGFGLGLHQGRSGQVRRRGLGLRERHLG